MTCIPWRKGGGREAVGVGSGASWCLRLLRKCGEGGAGRLYEEEQGGTAGGFRVSKWQEGRREQPPLFQWTIADQEPRGRKNIASS